MLELTIPTLVVELVERACEFVVGILAFTVVLPAMLEVVVSVALTIVVPEEM